MDEPGAAGLAYRRLGADGGTADIRRVTAVERPVAIEIDGLGYAVMMATPADLDDFAAGFCLSERLIDTAGDLLAGEAHETERGTVLRLSLRPVLRGRVVERVRHRVAETACGLCGIENLEQALRPLPKVSALSTADAAAIFAALRSLRGHQPLNAATGAVHGAALCGADGAVRLVREDVGRHNAFDKLIGAMLRGGIGWDGGFALLTSRCSYELVEKAVLAGCPLLVTVSMATSLAVARAAEAGLRLVVLARPDAMLEADGAGRSPGPDR